ncbi:MAG: helix-turn-helix domain-containing protein [Actinobacteria bacterium]|nr:helix-turn-helix domain-containing protein [Actinomycetota bacterium]
MGKQPSATREDRARIFAALGDPTRLAVVELLAVQDLSPDALAASLEIPANLLAHHLNVLQEAGVIRRVHSKNDRRRTYVQSVPGALEGPIDMPGAFKASRVVFVCTHNSARSVLAEALWREASDIPSASAGTSPADRINPRAVKAARKAGVTVTAPRPRSIDDVLRPDDVIVSVCDAVNEELPDLAHPRIHWSIPDPASVGTDAAFTATVVELRDRVSNLAPRISLRTRSRKASA